MNDWLTVGTKVNKLADVKTEVKYLDSAASFRQRFNCRAFFDDWFVRDVLTEVAFLFP